jgi:hypothetical protein
MYRLWTRGTGAQRRWSAATADGRARPDTGLGPEDGDHQVREPVHHLWVLAEVLGGPYHAERLDEPGHLRWR